MRTFTIRLKLTFALAVTVVLSLSFIACGGGTQISAGAGATRRAILYVTTIRQGQAEIISFDIDPSTGALVARSATKTTSSTPDFMVSMETDPVGGFLYASNFNSGKVHTYSIDLATGVLGDVTGSPFSRPGPGGNGGRIRLSPNGRFLFYADESGGVGVFSISAGVLTTTGFVNQSVASNLAVDPSNRFLVATNTGAPEFLSFTVDAGTGALGPASASPVPPNSGPYEIAFHPNGRFVYSTLSNGFTTPNGVVLPAIAALTMSTTTGVLAPVPGSPFTYGTGVMEAESMVMHPSGRFLYASTWGGIMAFTIDSNTGALTVVSGSPYPGVGPFGGLHITNQLAIDPSGNFLYGSSLTPVSSLNGVMAFTINQSTGSLTPIPGSPFLAGDSPGPLAVVRLR